MRCLSCKYDLRNLSENRCPECGRVFDPNDPLTFLPDAGDRRPIGWIMIWLLVCIVALVLITLYLNALGEA